MSNPQVQRPAPVPQNRGASTLIGATAGQVLAKAQSGRTVVQDSVPLAESLEWELGQRYLRERGVKSFLSDFTPVPYIVNNDGTLSEHAAAVFFASLAEAEKAGALAPNEEIYVLELGIGVGLFARFFLDAFRQLCSRASKDYYERLCYVAADRSERMLTDFLQHGLLANHPGKYRVRLVDALAPADLLPKDVALRQLGGQPFRAVFLNYLLDCLPAAVLDFQQDAVRQLHVRTCVARNVKLEEYTDLKPEQLAQRAKAGDPRAMAELSEVYGLFASEYEYRPVDVLTLPHGEFALQQRRHGTKRLLHSYGAIQCLDRLLPLVHERGFVLINDYGGELSQTFGDFEHQRFSLATFVGVNFTQLEKYFAETRRPHCRWIKPMGEGGGIHARLLTKAPLRETTVCFRARFGQEQYDKLQEPVQKARQWLQVGRLELAAAEYQEAVALQPWNWVLLNEVAMFLIFSQREVKAGIDVAKLALAQNPTCSAELYNTLGDGLFEWGRLAEARSAYQQAIAVNESDVRARYNLAWVYLREKDAEAALRVIAEGIALDKMGQYRERFLQKQQEALALQHTRNQQEYLLLINLVSRHAPPPGPEQPGRDQRPA